jgi:exopolysaccharide biosynthesis protein
VDCLDTVLERKDFSKVFEALMNFTLISVLVFSQNVLAKDVRLAQLGVSQEKPRIERFEETISQKYSNAVDVVHGVKHIKLTKYYEGKPVRINVIEADLGVSGLRLTPALANENLQSRRTISAIAKNSDAIVALNGTYFKPQTGVPLGTLMIDGKIYTGPIYDRVAMGIFDNGFNMARVQLNATLKSGKETIKVDNINQPRMLASYVLVYTPEWGTQAPTPPQGGKAIAVSGGLIVESDKIPQDGFVVVGPAAELDKIGNKAELSLKISPGWEDVRHIISGGPYLVKDSEVFVDMTAQKLNAISGRNPRSAIGYTAEGNLVLVAVDGREGSSVGMTLMELGAFMKSIGCVNAMNLDGGGSTVMYVNGAVVNSPAQTGGIPVSNAIVLAK